MVKRLLATYEPQLLEPPQGTPFQQSHDWDSIQPCQAYIDLCGKVKDELRGYGLKFK
jgi:hypothetical protein